MYYYNLVNISLLIFLYSTFTYLSIADLGALVDTTLKEDNPPNDSYANHCN